MPRRRRKPQQPAPEPQSAIPLTADSLGAQLLLTVSEQVGEISREVADVARTLTHYRGVLLLVRANRQRSVRL